MYETRTQLVEADDALGPRTAKRDLGGSGSSFTLSMQDAVEPKGLL